MHSHFIPGIDDGAQTMEDSLALLRSMSELGYSKVVTTPHVMSDAYRNTPEIILGGLEKVRARLKEERIALEIDAAAEYYLDFDFERKIDGGGLLSFGNRFVLFELSFMNPPDNLNNIIFKLITSGYRPVLAHPERYTYWHNKFEQYEALVEKGTLLQLNIASLTGHYSLSTKKIAEQLIEKDMISLLGSDCHHPGHISLIREARYEKALHTVLERGKLLNSSL
ncbi:MAG: CpsB/CapC family capsule biosynthesis tyrosine phosphatase [Bacteroidota bacterium]